jgi:hypothetical protein
MAASQPTAGTPSNAAPPTPTESPVRVSPAFEARYQRPCAAAKKCLMGGLIMPSRPDVSWGLTGKSGPGPDTPGDLAVIVSRTDKKDAAGKEARVLLHKACALAAGLHVPESSQTDLDSFLDGARL